MLAAFAATAVTVGVLVAAWIVIGPTGLTFAWITHFTLMFWVVLVAEARASPLGGRWFRVRPWETAVYPAVGARLYGKVLDVVGWNRLVARGRAFSGSRAGLQALDQHTRRSEAGHLLCLLVTATLVGAVAWAGQWGGVAWLAGLGVVLHVYPAMLQRLLRARIQVVLGRMSGSTG